MLVGTRAIVVKLKTPSHHFRLPGHMPHRNIILLPQEIFQGDVFLQQSKEKLYISKLGS